MTSRILALALVSALSGCTTDALVRDFVLPDCPPGPTDKATTRAAACMSSAMYEIAQKREEEKDAEADPRSREPMP